MKKSTTLLWLAGLQVVIAVVLAGLCAGQVYETRILNNQSRVLTISSQNQRSLNVLATATLEFAKTNRAFDAALTQSGLKDTPPSTPAKTTNAPKR